MTIEALIPINRYLGDGVQTVFPVAFPIFGDGRHVRAVISIGSGGTLEERELVYGPDYSVAALASGGECVTTAPVPAGRTLTLFLELPCAQPRDFDNLGRLDAEEIETGLDYLTALVAQNAAGMARALQVPVGDPQSPADLLQSVFTAGNQASTCRDAACECRDEACACATRAGIAAARAEEARDVAIAQTLAANTLMAAEMAKINLVAEALRDDMRELAENAQAVPDDNGLAELAQRVAGLEDAELEQRISSLEDLVASIGGNSGGNSGAMPLATDAAGVGQVVHTINATVPPGGTWLVFGYATVTLGDISGRFFPSQAASLHVGIHAGGTTITGMYEVAGLICWRIA
jgi:hypothetical protein